MRIRDGRRPSAIAFSTEWQSVFPSSPHLSVSKNRGGDRYKPREFTITGNLNVLLKERGYKFNIVNAGIEGQSTYGHIYNFKHWFPRLKDFSPKLYIFYIGINDQGAGYNKIEDNLGGDGHVKNPELLEVFFDGFKSKSFFYDKLRILKQKYYTTGKKLKYNHNFLSEKDISYFFNMFIEGHTFLPAIGRIIAIVKIKVQQRFSLSFQKRIDSQLE